MYKAIFLFSALLLITLTAAAQRQNVYFFNDKDEYLKTRDSATYLRIVQEPAGDPPLYVVNEFYTDGTKKSAGFSSKIDPPQYEGPYVSFYKNGNKKQIATYSKGKLTDTAYNYFPNGNLYTSMVYKNNESSKEVDIYYVTVNDSTGKELVVRGEGESALYDDQFKAVTSRGKIKNGKFDGVWTGVMNGGKVKYSEKYVDGKLISGESTDSEQNVYTYTVVRKQPEFKGGNQNFYKFLTKNITYPKAGVNGKVQLRFTVKANGQLSDFKVISSPHPLLTVEALRVLQMSPDWEPGLMRGRAVDVFFNLPISFNRR